MNSEVLVEEGIVISAGNGLANVAVIQSQNCNECSAKIICKPNTGNENIITVEDPYGVKVGDQVRFEIKGSALLSASFTLYGIPLILLLVGIFLGLSIFSSYKAKEVYSFFFGIGLMALYFLLTLRNSSKSNKDILPKIVSVKHNS